MGRGPFKSPGLQPQWKSWCQWSYIILQQQSPLRLRVCSTRVGLQYSRILFCSGLKGFACSWSSRQLAHLWRNPVLRVVIFCYRLSKAVYALSQWLALAPVKAVCMEHTLVWSSLQPLKWIQMNLYKGKTLSSLNYPLVTSLELKALCREPYREQAFKISADMTGWVQCLSLNLDWQLQRAVLPCLKGKLYLIALCAKIQ